MNKKTYQINGYNVHTTKTNKFKTCNIVLTFKIPFDKSKVAQYNMLAHVLKYSNKIDNTRKKLIDKKEYLYSTSFISFVNRLGNDQYLIISTDFIDPKYCEENTLEQIIELISNCILNPNIQDNQFEQTSFDIAKQKLKSLVESESESPLVYSFNNALKELAPDSPISAPQMGTLEEIEETTSSSLYQTYKEFLNNSECEIYIAGNLDMSKTTKLIKKHLPLKTKEIKKEQLVLDIKEKTVKKESNYEQSILIYISTFNNMTKYEEQYVSKVFDYIFSEGSLTSKLGKSLREENSLCYYVSGSYNYFDKIHTVYSGIDKEKFDLAIKLINKAIKEMQNGDITDQSIKESKKHITNAIKVRQNNISSITLEKFNQKNQDNYDTKQQKIKNINNVTKEDLINLALKMEHKLTYLMMDKGEK